MIDQEKMIDYQQRLDALIDNIEKEQAAVAKVSLKSPKELDDPMAHMAATMALQQVTIALKDERQDLLEAKGTIAQMIANSVQEERIVWLKEQVTAEQAAKLASEKAARASEDAATKHKSMIDKIHEASRIMASGVSLSALSNELATHQVFLHRLGELILSVVVSSNDPTVRRSAEGLKDALGSLTINVGDQTNVKANQVDGSKFGQQIGDKHGG